MESSPLLSKQKTFHSKSYLVELFLDNSRLRIKLKEDKAKGSHSGDFSIHFIETLTHKAGSSKKFNVFLNMLISAIEGTSSAVLIDFESHSDLEKLRNKPLQGNSSNSYLILTYIAEFDKVYYPLPLVYVPAKDLPVDELSLLKLKHENSCLAEENFKLKSELETHRQEKESLKKDLESFKVAMNKEIQSLQGLVEDLRKNLGKDQAKVDCERLEFEKKVLEAEIKSLKMLNKKRKLKIHELRKMIDSKENKERSKSLLGGENDVTKTSSRWKSSVRSSYNSEEISAKLEKIVNLLTVNERSSVFY